MLFMNLGTCSNDNYYIRTLYGSSPSLPSLRPPSSCVPRARIAVVATASELSPRASSAAASVARAWRCCSECHKGAPIWHPTLIDRYIYIYIYRERERDNYMNI